MKALTDAKNSKIVQKINHVFHIFLSPKLAKLRTLLIVGLFVLTLISGTGFLYNRSFDTRDKAANAAIATGNFVQWWPNHSTPWAYSGKTIGGVSFMNYNRATMKARLASDILEMVKVHKPGMVLLLASWSDLIPPATTTVFPEKNVQINQIWDGKLKFDYFDDVITIMQSYGIKVMLYPIVTASGGQVPYPMSYYSKTGWFWKRPDWQNGLANPLTDAMRYPPAAKNGSNYDWCAHTAGYVNVDCAAPRHQARTSDGIEETGLGPWKTYETADMVFNGYDTGLHDNKLHLLTPIPSLSSKAYRDLTRDSFKQIGVHYKNMNIAGYFLYQEPSYAHLRENINYCPHVDTQSQAGNTCMYEVDYSPAETNAYNEWGRIYKGFPKDKITPIPYPVNATYSEFRNFNIAGFMLNLKEGLREGNGSAPIIAPLFEDDTIKGMGTNSILTLQVLKPEIIIVEPPHFIKDKFKDLTKADAYIATLKQAYPASSFISYDTTYEANFDHQGHDRQIAAILQKHGFKQYWVPAIVNRCIDAEGYPHWLANWKSCDKMTFRYRTPGGPATPSASPTVSAKPTVIATAIPTITSDLPRGTNLLKNPSFESGFSNWTLHTTNKAVYTNNAYPAKSGSSFIDSNSNQSDISAQKNTIYQDLTTPLSSGLPYRFGMYIRKITNATQYFRVAVWGFDAKGTPTQLCTKFMPLNASTTWNEYGCSFTTTQSYSSVRVQLFLDTPNVNYNIDNAYFGR